MDVLAMQLREREIGEDAAIAKVAAMARCRDGAVRSNLSTDCSWRGLALAKAGHQHRFLLCGWAI